MTNIIIDRTVSTENYANQRACCVDENITWQVTTSTKAR